MSTNETDYITEKIGKFGKFQLRGFLLIQFVGIISAWQTFVRFEAKLNIRPTLSTFSVHQLHPARGGLLVQPGQPPAGLRGEVGLQGQSDQGGDQLHRPLPHVHRGI